ncbi:MAG TPA: MBL fold metallo-hydrolase [Gammaproteobacteria bacterium]|nr:MBL fold metallo-hydrolase [Gammaproteobacteria bacterium]
MSIETTRPRGLLAVIAIAVFGAGLGREATAQQEAPPPVVNVLEVRDDIYMLVGQGGNITMQVGDDGILIVDTQFANMSEAIVAAIRETSDKPIRYIINTHHHGDHIGGNGNLRLVGDTVIGGNMPGAVPYAEGGGAQVVSHENVLLRLSGALGGQAGDPSLWPTNTFFNEEKQIHFNGEGVRIVHQPAAHTDGDVVVFFRRSDVIAAGDFFRTTGWPRIDLNGGGSYRGTIAALNNLVDLMIPVYGQDGGTLVIPGHGRLSGIGDVLDFREMAIVVGDRIEHMIEEGMSLEQIIAARPALDYEPVYGTPGNPEVTDQFVESVYLSLMQERD